MNRERLDTLTILHFVIKKGGSRVARHGKSEAQREYYQARDYRKWRFPHKRRRVQTAGSPRTLSHTHCSFSLCASSQKQFSPRSHAMFRTPLDPRFTAPSQSTPTFLHNCSLQSGLPLLLRCVSDFAQQSTLTKSEAQREYCQAKVRKGSKLFFNASKDVKLIEVRS